MSFRSCFPLGLILALAPRVSLGQVAPPPPSGHPAHVGSGDVLFDARAIAIARHGDRALIAYVQAVDPRARGSVRTAVVSAQAGHPGVQRESPNDAVLAPLGATVAVSWDGTRGAVVYTVPRPHRGEVPGTHRQRPGATERALADPLGSSALTAADIVLQNVDAHGAAVGAPVQVFEENSRAYRVAIAPDADGWIVAWTGGITTDAEITGTVRWSRVDANGRARAAASDTGFAGQVGDALRVMPMGQGRVRAIAAFPGERCVALEGRAALTEPPLEPPPPGRTLRFQQPAHEHTGPPIDCTARTLFTVELHNDGTTSAIVAGPTLSSDAIAAVPTPQRWRLLTADADGALRVRDVGSNGTLSSAQTLATTPPAASSQPPAGATAADELTPSHVAPALAPDGRRVAAQPAVLEASLGDDVLFAAVSPTRGRIAAGTVGHGGVGLTLLRAGPEVFEIALGGAWLLSLGGSYLGGPVTFVDTLGSDLPRAEPEPVWLGDERFRQHLLRARAARAAYTTAVDTYGPLSERPDAATNPRMPGLLAGLRHFRALWETACEPLNERAHFLARHGVDATIVELAREQCEMPEELLAVPATTATTAP